MDTQATTQLNDKQVKQALWRAGIPARYHAKDYTFTSSDIRQATVNEFTEFIETLQPLGNSKSSLEPEQKEVAGQLFITGKNSIEASYLLARGLTLSGLGAYVTSLPDIFQRRREPDFADAVSSALVFVVTGITEAGGARLAGEEEQLYSVQWWLQKLQDSGKIVVLQGETTIDKSPWWGKSFQRQVTRNFNTLTT